jgi:hypothetical protein
MSKTIHNAGITSLQRAEQTQPVYITEERINSLPEIVQRYLRYTGVVGKEAIRTVHLKQEGFMRLQPDQKWLPVVAEQYFTTDPLAFLWRGKIKPLPLVAISATDRFSDGHGNMLVKLWSLITLGDAHGPEVDQGELQRYLAEISWFPTSWLSDAITWQVIDAHSVKTIYNQQGVTASIVLHINEQGQLTHVTADRYREEHGRYRLTPWLVRLEKEQEIEGLRIPTRFEVSWHLPSGEFSWFRARITEIEYN